MGTTARGYPYPEPTDPVAQGADAIRALAEAVDARIIGGTVTVRYTGSGAGAIAPVTFPLGLFTVPPAVTVTPIAYSRWWGTVGGAPTKDGFNAGAMANAQGAASDVVCHWIAVSRG